MAKRFLRRLLPRTTYDRLLMLLLLTLVPVIVFEVGLHFVRWQERRAGELRVNLDAAKLAAANFDFFVWNTLRQEATLGMALAAIRPPTTEHARDILATAAAEQPRAWTTAWLGPDGNLLAASGALPEGFELTLRQLLDELGRGRDWVVSDLVADRRDGAERPVFAIVRGIRSDGRMLGAIAVVVDGDDLGGMLTVERTGDASIAFLDRQGRLVHRHPELPVRWEERYFDREQPLVRSALDGATVSGTMLSPLDGQSRMAGLAPIPSIGWVAVADELESEAMAAISSDMSFRSGLLFLVGLAGFFVALSLGRSITLPVRRLREHALALASGNLAHRVTPAGPVEVEEVCDALNQMAAEIQSREELLRENEERWRSAISNSPDTMYAQDFDLRTIWIVSRHPLVSLDSIIGKTDFDVLPADEARRIVDIKRHVLESGVGEQADVAATVGGEQRHFETAYEPRRDRHGRVIGLYGYCHDVTERKRSEELREDYIHTISHDLRAPLTIVQGQAQVALRDLQRTGGSDRLVRSLQAILTSARRMNAMIQDLVDAARIQSGQLSLNPGPLDLRASLTDLKERLPEAFGPERIRLELPERLPMVYADPDRLERILMNLLGNALKYSPRPSEVQLRVEVAENEVIVAVADRGPGIQPEELPHLFERFYRSAGAHLGKDGLGLGLYITKSLIEAHRGRIWVKSEPGRGSTFYFTLPIHRSMGSDLAAAS